MAYWNDQRSKPSPTPNGRRQTPEPTTEEAAERVTETTDELAELKDRHLRLAAEFDNYRKRVQRDRAEQRLRDRDEVIGEWLEVVDNVERAIESSPDDPRVWLDGTKAIYRQMLSILKKYDVTPIPSDGQPFDPNRHEAVGMVPYPGKADEVVHTDRKGYERPDRVLRPARVVVAKGE